jgi:O-antigen/teichoic acid export membrane protein
MLGGTVVSIVTVLLFQIVAGRSLGAEAFAPIGVLWTVSFMVYTVFMIPVEQFITRRLALAHGYAGALAPDRVLLIFVLGVGIALGVGFVALTFDRLFAGSTSFIGLAVALLGTRGLLAVGRGFLAGRRRFTAYGSSLAAEGLTLLIAAAIVAATHPTTMAFAVAMVISPMAILLFSPFRATPASGHRIVDDAAPVAFLGFLILATAASQIVIASGPVVVGLIGGGAAAVSSIFVTFTLFRGPITSAYNLVARVLPDFTALAAQGRAHVLTVWAHRIAWAGYALAVAGFVAAYLIGSSIIRVLYGAEFAPDPAVAGFAGAGVGAGLAVLFVAQIYVATGATRALAGRWLVALVFAAAAVAFGPGSPSLRIALGFAVGEIAALTTLGFAVGIPHGGSDEPRRSDVQGVE